MAAKETVSTLRYQRDYWANKYLAEEKKLAAVRSALVALLSDDFEPKHHGESYE